MSRSDKARRDRLQAACQWRFLLSACCGAFGTIGLNAADLLSNVRLLGIKRTSRALVSISANDPKRTCSRAMGHCDIQSNLTARWVNSGFRCLLKQPDEGLELFDRRVGHDPIGDLSIAPA